MRELVPKGGFGEFVHGKRICSNSGKTFTLVTKHSKEFRERVRAAQQQRTRVATSDGYVLTWTHGREK